MGEPQALSVHDSSCRFLPDNTGVVLRPNPAGECQEESALCPVRSLKIYIQRTASFRKTYQLFICFRPQCLDEPVSKARLSHWVVEVIQQAYRETGEPVPVGVRAHPTWVVSTSWTLWQCTYLSEVCVASSSHPALASCRAGFAKVASWRCH